MSQLQEERHFSSQCFKKAMSNVTDTATHSEDSRDCEYFDTSFLGTVDAEGHSSYSSGKQPTCFIQN